MRSRLLLPAVGALLLIGAAPAAQTDSAGGPVPIARSPSEGYLSKDEAPDTLKILPRAPTPGTSRYEADRTIYLQTRSLKDTPRWALAQNDIEEPLIVHDMACAIGVELTPKSAPKTFALLSKMRTDVRHAVNTPKDFYKRQRPYLIDEGPICDAKTESLAKSPDYPSGHNSWGWSVGLVLAELVPDRKDDILVRARAFGESRIVCGVHNLSAVEAGRLNASIIVASLHGSAQFRSDMDAARAEIAAARKAAGPKPDPAACAKEAELIAQPLY